MSNTEWTNSEASCSKLALSELGYINDPFIKLFGLHPLKRTPEINRGYYYRTAAISHVVHSFCNREGPTAQVVNIGAGYDTLFWRMSADSTVNFARFVEVDSNEVVGHKIKIIREHESLLQHCGAVQSSANSAAALNSERYHVIAQDATKGLQLVNKLVKNCQINKSEPILFIFECVLLYWNEEARTNLLYTLSKSFPKCNFAVFDLVNTGDKFSEVMQHSLSEHDTPLLGASSTRTLDDWKQQFEKAGCAHLNAWLMTDVFEHLIDADEKERIEKIEFLDEVELLTQLFNHYCIVLASNHTEINW